MNDQTTIPHIAHGEESAAASAAGSHAPSPRDLVAGFWRHANARDWDAFAALLEEAVVYEVPQTRERVRGRANYVEFNRTYPGDWRVKIVEFVVEGTRAVTVIDFLDGATAQTGITIFDCAGGRIARVVDYWPSPYEPPKRMTPHVERY